MVRSRLSLAALATVFLLLLAACSPGEELAEELAEQALEEQGGGDVEIDSDSGEVNIESDDGSFTIGGGEIPTDWPVDVPSGGEVLAVGEDQDGGGTLSMEFVGADYDDMVAFYDSWVDGSGLEMIQRAEVSEPAGHAWTVQDDARTYNISINDAGDFVALLIIVVPN
ncbi:MAG: hypothetical protein PVG83_06510 [Acidimicrobiia bacterium]